MSLSPSDPPACERPSVGRAIMRGLRLRCPACGQGKLLSGYLKPAAECSACGEKTGRISADDGPAWATILLVGHLVSPSFIMFAHPYEPAPWAPFAIVATLVTILSLTLLPRMKGLFIAAIWNTRAGAEASAAD
jgi:uncharacterized protein (DUF983 family)